MPTGALDPQEKLARELAREQEKRRRADLVIEAIERQLQELEAARAKERQQWRAP